MSQESVPIPGHQNTPVQNVTVPVPAKVGATVTIPLERKVPNFWEKLSGKLFDFDPTTPEALRPFNEAGVQGDRFIKQLPKSIARAFSVEVESVNNLFMYGMFPGMVEYDRQHDPQKLTQTALYSSMMGGSALLPLASPIVQAGVMASIVGYSGYEFAKAKTPEEKADIFGTLIEGFLIPNIGVRTYLKLTTGAPTKLGNVKVTVDTSSPAFIGDVKAMKHTPDVLVSNILSKIDVNSMGKKIDIELPITLSPEKVKKNAVKKLLGVLDMDHNVDETELVSLIRNKLNPSKQQGLFEPVAIDEITVATAKELMQTSEFQSVQAVNQPNKAYKFFKTKTESDLKSAGSLEKVTDFAKAKPLAALQTVDSTVRLFTQGDDSNILHQKFTKNIIKYENLQPTYETEFDAKYIKPILKLLGTEFNRKNPLSKSNLTTNQRLEMALDLNQDYTAKQLVDYNGFTQKQLRAEMSSLSTDELMVVRRVRDAIKEITPRRQKAFSLLKDAEVGMENPETYYPVNHEKYSQNVGTVDDVFFEGVLNSRLGLGKLPTGRAIMRVGAEGKLKLDFVSNWTKFLRDTARIQAASEVFPEIADTFNIVKGTMEKKVGPNLVSSLETSIRRTFASPIPAEGADALLKAGRMIMYARTLAFNVRSMFNQIASIPNAIDDIGAKDFFHGVLKGLQKGSHDELPMVIQKRYLDPTQADIGELAKYGTGSIPEKLAGIYQKAAQAGTSGLQAVDALLNAKATYFGALKHGLETLKMRPANAESYATIITIRNQGSSQTGFRPGVTTGNELTKSVFSFFTQPLQAYTNVQTHTIRYMNGKESGGEFVKHVVMQFVLPAAIITSVKIGTTNTWDKLRDKSPDAKKAVVWDIVDGFMSNIPYLAQAVSTIEYNKGSLTPFGSGVANNIVKSYDKFFTDLDNGEFTYTPTLLEDTWGIAKAHLNTLINVDIIDRGVREILRYQQGQGFSPRGILFKEVDKYRKTSSLPDQTGMGA